jgi:hypothetical protein
MISRRRVFIDKQTALSAVLLAFCSVNCLAQQSTTSTAPAPKGTFANDGESAPLGSVAHQQQAQKSSSAPSKRRVITDEDMPSHPAPAPVAKAPARSPQSKESKPADSSETSKAKDGSDDVLNAIKEQKIKTVGLQVDLNGLQERLDTWKGDDCRQYYASDGGSPDACREVKQLVADRDRTRKELEREQATLADMQEKARKAGYTSKVYDPD